MKEILQRFEQLLWEENISAEASAEELYQSLQEADMRGTWHWKDIDYANQLKSFWPAVKHYERMQIILNGFGKSRLSEDGEYAEKMIGALKYWLLNDFKNPNSNLGVTPKGMFTFYERPQTPFKTAKYAGSPGTYNGKTVPA
jgi:hypothetical protein